MNDTETMTVWSSPKDGTSLELRFHPYRDSADTILRYGAKCSKCGHVVDEELVGRPAIAVLKRWGQSVYRMTCGSMSKDALDAVMQTVVETVLDKTLQHVYPVKCDACHNAPVAK